MEQDHPGSRKRANPPVVPPNKRLCHSRSYEDHSQERPRGKRQRPGNSIIGPASPSNAFTVSANSSSRDALIRNFPNTYTETNANINVLEDGFLLLTPPGNPLGIPPYPSVDQLSQQQDVAGASVTYTISNGTFSPRSTNQQVLGNTNDCTAQSPDGASEPLFGGSDDNALDINNMLLWNIPNNSPPTFDDLGKSSF